MGAAARSVPGGGAIMVPGKRAPNLLKCPDASGGGCDGGGGLGDALAADLATVVAGGGGRDDALAADPVTVVAGAGGGGGAAASSMEWRRWWRCLMF